MAATPPAVAISFQPPSPDELKMTSEPQALGASAIILYRQLDRDDNPPRSHEDNYFRIKILTKEGLKYANVEIPFFTENENIVNIRARTVKPDGLIVDFGGKVYEKTIAKANGVKLVVKAFNLSGVEVGSVIEYSYTRDFSELYIFNSHWILSDELFTKRAQFSLNQYQLKPYQSYFLNPYRFRWITLRLPSGSEPKKGPDGIIRMEASNIAAFPTEDFMPPENEMKSRVDFIYEDDTVPRDPEKYWRQIGKAWNNSLDSFIGKRKALEKAVDQIVSAGDSPEVKLRKLYDRVQSLRNTAYEFQKTEQEEKRSKEKQALNAEEILKNGYGDRESLGRLFLALARAAGFEAYECRVSDRENYFFAPLTMESSKLHDNIVLVKVNGKDVYFDPGVQFAPFGLLAWSETGTQGLRLDGNGGTWIRTPLPQRSESRIERKAKLKLSEAGDLEGKVSVTYVGLEAMGARTEERNADEVARREFLEKQLKEQLASGAEIALTNKPDWSNAETPLIAEFDLKIPGWVSPAGKRAVMSIGIFTAGDMKIFEHSQRVHPIYFRYPYEKVDDVLIDIPSGWHISSLPNSLARDGHIVTYSVKIEDSNGILHVERRLGADAGMFDPKYYDALRNFFQLVRSGDEEQIVLQPPAAAGGK